MKLTNNIDSSESCTSRSFSPSFHVVTAVFFILKMLCFTYYDIVEAVTVDIRRGEAVAEVSADLAAGQIVQVRQVRVVENNLINNSISLSGVHQRLKGVGGWPDQDMASFLISRF
jgi:hypothetical protein